MRFLSALLLAALPLAAPGAHAAPVDIAVQGGGYGALANVLSGARGAAPALDASLQVVADRMEESDPILAEAEATFPGICDRLAWSMRPIFVRHQQRVAESYRPRMIAVLRSAMTAEEAGALAAFYVSPLGERISRGVARNAGGTAQGAVQPDGHAATLGAILTPREIAYVERFFGKGPGRKLTPVLPRLTALRAEMERVPLSADDRAEIKAVVARAVALFKVLPDPPSVLPPPKPLKLGPMPAA